MQIFKPVVVPLVLLLSLAFLAGTSPAAKVTLDLGNAPGVTLVGALDRFDQDGNLRRAVDPKASIDAPVVDFKASNLGGGKWVFEA